MKRYSYLQEMTEHNRKDEPVICTQLLFGETNEGCLKENNLKYIEQQSDQLETVKRIEKKYDISLLWEEIKVGDFYTKGYIMQRREKC